MGDSKKVIDYQSVLQIEGSGKYGIYAGNRDHSGWSVNIVRLILAVDVSSILLVQGSKRGSYRDSLSLMRTSEIMKMLRTISYKSIPLLFLAPSPSFFEIALNIRFYAFRTGLHIVVTLCIVFESQYVF